MTRGPDVAELAELADFAPDASQREILNAIFAQDERGRSAAFEVGVVCCRQNLKTAVFKQAVLGWLFLTGERLVVWSDHEFKTAKEDFRHLVELITGSDVLRPRIKPPRWTTGDESIELVDGPRLIFKTRTRGGGRGLTGDKVVLDEAFALQAAHMGALLPTLSARPDPQVLYGSSAGLADSAVLRGVRDRGRVGTDPRLAWFEWCAPDPATACGEGAHCTHRLDAPGCGCDVEANWAAANPSLGLRISWENIAAERRALPPAEFGRERMGWWDDPVEDGSPLPVDRWAASADEESAPVDPVAFAVDVPMDRSRSAIACAGRRVDGLGHGELVESRDGTDWVVDRLMELAGSWSPCVVVLDPGGPAGAMVPALCEAGFATDPAPGQQRLMLVSMREYAQACGALVDDVVNDRWRHRGQPRLDAAVRDARTRPLAEAWAWSRRSSAADVSPLVALTLARHGFAVHGPHGSYDVLTSIF